MSESLILKKRYLGIATLTIDGKDVLYSYDLNLNPEQFKEACKQFAVLERARRLSNSAAFEALIGQEIV